MSCSYCRGSRDLTADHKDMANPCSASGSFPEWKGCHLALEKLSAQVKKGKTGTLLLSGAPTAPIQEAAGMTAPYCGVSRRASALLNRCLEEDAGPSLRDFRHLQGGQGHVSLES